MDLARPAVLGRRLAPDPSGNPTPWLESEARRCSVAWILILGWDSGPASAGFDAAPSTGGPLCEPTLTEVLVVPDKGGPRVWCHLRPSTQRGCLGTRAASAESTTVGRTSVPGTDGCACDYRSFARVENPDVSSLTW